MKNCSLRFIPFVAAMMLLTVSCRKAEPSRNPEDHIFSRVLIYYGCGQNNLDYNLRNDIKEMTVSEGVFLPGLGDDKAVVVCYHGCKTPGKYTESGTTYTIWIYRDSSGNVVRDTLARDEFTTAADPEVMRRLMENVRKRFKSEHYGTVFSSHGTGWMPQGSYDDEEHDDFGWDFLSPGRHRSLASFGQERVGDADYYLDIPDMAASFPMKMDYIIFDSCLMGGVEVAYELSEVTPVIGFSQSEVPGDGFCYSTMLQRLLQENNPKAVMEDTYNYYVERGSYSVVSCINTGNLEPLAETCATLIEKYRSQLDEVDKDDIQQFYTGGHPWFFDLKDIFDKCGADDGELDELQRELDLCVTYSAHTSRIKYEVEVHTNCGFSMYLPKYGSKRLNDYYRTLAWNKATGLVE